MLFKRDVLAGIASGKITLAFRCWRKLSVKAGGRLRTAAGVLAIRSVEKIAADDIAAATPGAWVAHRPSKTMVALSPWCSFAQTGHENQVAS